MFELVLLGGEVVGLIILIAVGVAWLRSRLAQQNCLEAAKLADTRGERIEDLEAHVKRQDLAIAELRGQIEMLRRLKVEEIVEGVVEGIVPFLSQHNETFHKE